ncbi:DUF86 domain-containing protein [Pseudobacillus sp. 179-B 2D1 NHS]|uniref:type VII toxin-antitoxin system HepT family RNase toxin n=1 Tax=Pseudobacillus sp. 179-B 2D1 NHS TaxID=3374292 RepID=UPI00387A27BF
MKNDVILNKIAIIERCIKRIYEEYNNTASNLEKNTQQESIILNLQRACGASVDLAMSVIADRKQCLPKNSHEAFNILEDQGIIPSSLSSKMKTLIEFGRSAAYEEQEVSPSDLERIIKNHLVDFMQFTKTILLY